MISFIHNNQKFSVQRDKLISVSKKAESVLQNPDMSIFTIEDSLTNDEFDSFIRAIQVQVFDICDFNPYHILHAAIEWECPTLLADSQLQLIEEEDNYTIVNAIIWMENGRINQTISFPILEQHISSNFVTFMNILLSQRMQPFIIDRILRLYPRNVEIDQNVLFDFFLQCLQIYPFDAPLLFTLIDFSKVSTDRVFYLLSNDWMDLSVIYDSLYDVLQNREEYLNSDSASDDNNVNEDIEIINNLKSQKSKLSNEISSLEQQYKELCDKDNSTKDVFPQSNRILNFDTNPIQIKLESIDQEKSELRKLISALEPEINQIKEKENSLIDQFYKGYSNFSHS